MSWIFILWLVASTFNNNEKNPWNVCSFNHMWSMSCNKKNIKSQNATKLISIESSFHIDRNRSRIFSHSCSLTLFSVPFHSFQFYRILILQDAQQSLSLYYKSLFFDTTNTVFRPLISLFSIFISVFVVASYKYFRFFFHLNVTHVKCVVTNFYQTEQNMLTWERRKHELKDIIIRVLRLTLNYSLEI